MAHIGALGWAVVDGYPESLSAVPAVAVMWPETVEDVAAAGAGGRLRLIFRMYLIGAVGLDANAARTAAERLYRLMAHLRAFQFPGAETTALRAVPTGVEVLNVGGTACSGGAIEMTLVTYADPIG